MQLNALTREALTEYIYVLDTNCNTYKDKEELYKVLHEENYLCLYSHFNAYKEQNQQINQLLWNKASQVSSINTLVHTLIDQKISPTETIEWLKKITSENIFNHEFRDMSYEEFRGNNDEDQNKFYNR